MKKEKERMKKKMRYYVQEEEKLLANKIAERNDKIKISAGAIIIFGALISLGYSVVGVQITESKGWQKAVCNIQDIQIGKVQLCLYKSDCVLITYSGYANVSSGTVPFSEQERCYDTVTKCVDSYSVGEDVNCCYKKDVFRFGEPPSYDKLLLVITILFTPFFLYSCYSLVSAYKERIEN